jgi:hypothetical protein
MVMGWFYRLFLIFAILAVFAFDGISIVAAHFTASDDAQTAAQAAAQAYRSSGLAGAAILAAEQSLPKGDTLVPGSVKIDNAGDVSLQVHRTARSVLLHLLSQTKNWSVVTESGSAASPS